MDFLIEHWRVGLGLAVTLLVWWRLAQKPIRLNVPRPRSSPLRRTPIPLVKALPELAAEIEILLASSGEHELASQVPALEIVDRCRCDDGFCSTFYSRPKPEGAYPKNHTVELAPERGMIHLDVSEGRIVCVEVLYRDDVKSKLHILLP